MVFSLLLALWGCNADCTENCAIEDKFPWDTDEQENNNATNNESNHAIEPRFEEDISDIRTCDVSLRFKPNGSPSNVAISGEFNNWEPAQLEGPDSDGIWHADLGELQPGHYAYKLVLDGNYETSPPINFYTKWVDGFENRKLTVGDCQQPLLTNISTVKNDSSVQAEIQFSKAADGSEIDVDSVIVTLGGEPVNANTDPSTG